MYSSKLSLPLDISTLETNDEIIEELYKVFTSDLMNQHNRNKLHGNFIFMDCNKWIKYKNEVFWHLISLDQKEQFNILPCNNCASGSKCTINCLDPYDTVVLANGQKRNVCFYRGIRIKWINEIIELANKNDSSVKTWKKNVVINNTKRTQLFIRFTHEAVDYIIIFEEKYKRGELKNYYFVTAFPLFYINSKRGYDKDYAAYINLLSPVGK